MFYIVKGELAPFTVFEPLLANLIAVNVKAPNFRRHVLEILLPVNPNAPLVRSLPWFCVAHRGYRVITNIRVTGKARCVLFH